MKGSDHVHLQIVIVKQAKARLEVTVYSFYTRKIAGHAVFKSQASLKLLLAFKDA